MTVNEKEESWLSVEAVKVSWSPQPVDASPNMMTATATQRGTPDSLGHNFSQLSSIITTRLDPPAHHTDQSTTFQSICNESISNQFHFPWLLHS